MSAQCRGDGPTLYPEDVFAAVPLRAAAATDRFGLVVGRAGRVDHGDDGHVHVDPQHVVAGIPEKCQDCQNVPILKHARTSLQHGGGDTTTARTEK